MLLLMYSLSVDCFRMSTTAEYDTQRETIQFNAVPSQQLTGENKNLCESVINNQEYIIYLQVGSSIFESKQLVYNSSNKIYTELSCQNGSKCELVDIQDVSAVRYILYFMNLDFNLSAIVNQYNIINYDHTDCIRDAEMVYDSIKTSINIYFRDRPKHCKNSGNGNNIILREYVNGKEKVNTALPKVIFSVVFPNSGVGATTQITDIWEKFQMLGPLTSAFVSGLDVMIAESLQNFFNQILIQLGVDTTITQKDSAGNNVSLKYTQATSFYILRKRNIVQDDCLKNVKLIIQRTSITIFADKNDKSSQCGQQYITSQGFDFDAVKFLLVATQNEDYSGFIFDGLYEVPEYQLGNSVKYTISCKNEEECKSFAKILELQQLSGNISLILEHAYLKNGQIVLRSQYIPEITEALYQEIDITLRQDSICATFKPLDDQIYEIIVKIDVFNFALSVYGAPSQQKYCQRINEFQVDTIPHLLNTMQQKKITANDMQIFVEGQAVTTVTAKIYFLVSEKASLIYVIIVFTGIIAALVSGICFVDFSMQALIIIKHNEPETN